METCFERDVATWHQGAQTGVIVEGRKGSSVKDDYYRGDIGFYVNVFFTVSFAIFLLMIGLGYW